MTARRDLSAIDPRTGKLVLPISVDVHLADEPLPRMFHAASWQAAAAILKTAEFKALSGRVSFVTITNREAP